MKLWLQVEAGLGQNFLGDGHIYRRRGRNHRSEYTQKIKRGKRESLVLEKRKVSFVSSLSLLQMHPISSLLTHSTLQYLLCSMIERSLNSLSS